MSITMANSHGVHQKLTICLGPSATWSMRPVMHERSDMKNKGKKYKEQLLFDNRVFAH